MALDPKIKAIGFDMDGTVMDTDVDYVKLAHIVEDEFVSLGVPDEIIDLDKKDATTKYSIEWLTENKPESLKGLEERIGNRATAIEMENSDRAMPFEGAVELLRDLRAMGYRLAVLTRGGRQYALKILGNSDMLELFDAVVARDDYPQNESKPDRKSIEHICEKMGVSCEETLYVGDSTVDYLTAKNSGSPFVGVESGDMNRDAWVRAAGESVVTVPTVADIRRFL